jgi:hypothetical protein
MVSNERSCAQHRKSRLVPGNVDLACDLPQNERPVAGIQVVEIRETTSELSGD